LPAEAEVHISAELSRGGVDWRSSGRKNIKMNCPFPHEKGADSGYNLEITKDGRMVHCWICDWSGSWDKLARELGLSEFNSEFTSTDTYTSRVAEMNVFGKLLEDLDEVVDDETLSVLPEDDLFPWRRASWRGLRRSFLKRLPSYLWKHRVELKNDQGQVFKTFFVDRILWPYNQYGRLVGYVGRRLDKGDKVKYYRAEWCKAKECLFPFDYLREYHEGFRTLVLVEGEVDALSLLGAGIPALSILGSTNWSEKKRDLLLSLGIQRVILLMDGDPAGRKAAKEIKGDLHGYFDISVLKLAEGEDPGDMDEDQLEWLRNRVFPEMN
jgi:DNA primase